jgi:recombinational DNA repair ATPase RecF
MSKIKKISVNNLRNINHLEVDLNGCTAVIVGGNNKGKSTLCRALIDRFRGIKNDNIVRINEIDGRYEMHLTSGEIFVWEIDCNGKEKVTIISDRKKEKVTKEMMQYYFPVGFDVDKFLNEGSLKQQKTLQQLSGLDFTEVERAYKQAYEDRTYQNKRCKEEEAKQILMEPHWEEHIRDIKPLEEELENISFHNMRYETVKNKVAEKKATLLTNYTLIEKLKKEIETLQEDCMQLETDIDKGDSWLSEEERKPKSNKYRQNLKDKIEDIKNNNAALEGKHRLIKIQLNALEADETVKKIISDKEEMIRLADMPEGFGFSEEGITYNGLPYDKKNQSSSALYIGALKLAARVIGEVKCIHFDASFLDKNSLQQIQEWAESNNLQLLIERPDWEGGEIRYEIIED